MMRQSSWTLYGLRMDNAKTPIPMCTMSGCCRFKVVDTGPAFAWQREFISRAPSRDGAHQEYLAACQEARLVPGTVHIFKVRDLAAFA